MGRESRREAVGTTRPRAPGKAYLRATRTRREAALRLASRYALISPNATRLPPRGTTHLRILKPKETTHNARFAALAASAFVPASARPTLRRDKLALTTAPLAGGRKTLAHGRLFWFHGGR